MTENIKDVLEWDELSRPDQIRAEELLKELNEIFDRSLEAKKARNCEDSTSDE